MSKGKKKGSVRRSPEKEAAARREAARKSVTKPKKSKPVRARTVKKQPGKVAVALEGIGAAFGRLIAGVADRATSSGSREGGTDGDSIEIENAAESSPGPVFAPAVPAARVYRPTRAHLGQWRTAMRVDARAWIGSRGFEIWLLVGIWAVVSLVVFWLATGHESPRRYQDEFLFWGVAKAFAAGDGITWRGVDIGLRSPLYPMLLAPAYWIGGSVASTYTLVHLLDSMMMVAVVFPAFLMARFFMDRWKALIVALFAIASPAMNYAGIIGTESLAYPVAAAAFGTIVHAIAIPRPRSWLFALAAIFIAILTRTQFVIFLPIFFASMILAGLMREPGTRRDFFRKQGPVLATAGAVLAIGALVLLVQGKQAVGLYAGVFEGVSPTLSDIWFWFKSFAADVFILTAILPAIAVLALAFERDMRRNPMIGALIATSLVAALGFIVEVTWFSATNPYDWRGRHIFYERYMFYLGPLLFTGLLVAWRRVSMRAVLAASIIGTFTLAGFQSEAVLVPFSYDSFALTTAGQLMDDHKGLMTNIGMAFAGLGALLGAVYCLSTVTKSNLARYASWLVIAAPMAILLWGQAQTWHYARIYSHDSFAGYPKPADFIDAATDKDVGMFITSTDSPEMYFTAEFWNDRITRAFASAAAPFQTPVMYSPKCSFDWSPTGEILAPGCDKIPNAFFIRSKDVSIHLRDETKRVHPQPGLPDLTLIEAPAPRFLSIVGARNVITGAVTGKFDVLTFLDRPGQLRITVEPTVRPTKFSIEKTTTVVQPRRQTKIVAPLPANDSNTHITVNSLDAVAQEVGIKDIEVREGDGPWISIT